MEQRHIDLAPDASQVNEARAELQILDAAAIQQLGQMVITYSDTTQEVKVDEAYTLKKDGTKLAVSPNAIITQQRPGTSTAPMLTDQKQKVVIFPNVEVGDTLVSVRTLKAKPLFPGLFAYGQTFPQGVEVDKYDLVYTTPKSLPLYFDAKDVAVEQSTDGDKLVYAVHRTNPTAVPSPLQYVSSLDRSPYLFVSTMKTWEQFSKLYGKLVEPKLAVTPKLQAKADEVTAGASNKREQAQKIYEWVSSHIRYVALEFGQGGYVPHDPEEVLTNAYGDCKDHAALFAVLLKAKGIAADLVVIHATDSYTIPNIPVTGVFNHMINYIPSLSLYADTTQRTMAFGYLPRGEYGKSVLHVGATGKALRQVPLLIEKDSSFTYSEHLTLTADGRLTGDGQLTASGVAAGLAHREGLRLRATGVEKAANDLLEKRGMTDATGRFEVPSSEAATPTYTASAHYTAPKQIAMVSGIPFAMPKGLALESLSDDFWIGPIAADKYKKADIMPCYSGSGSETYTLDLPAGKKLAALPADTKIEADGLKYNSHWSQGPHSVTVKRDLALHFAQALCRGPQRAGIREALAKIKTDLGTTIALVVE